jgi:AcrR family transcriptional regulator
MDGMVAPTSRLYSGQNASERSAGRRERFLEAGLELMGNHGMPATTVRAVIAEAGLAPRYFYELFADLAELQVAVLDKILAEAERRGIQALLSVPDRPKSRTRAVLAEMVDLLLDDPRKGRVLLVESLASPAMGARRMDETVRFAHLLATHSGSAKNSSTEDPAVQVSTHYALNGFIGTMAAVIDNRIQIERPDLVERLTNLFQHIGRPAPARA